LLFSCRNEENKLENMNSKNEISVTKSQIQVFKRDTLINDNQKFIVKHFRDDNLDFSLLILNDKFDTIYKHFDYIDEYEILDFNEDGFKDLRLDYITNTPDVVDIVLFDSNSKRFEIVKDLGYYPSPFKIKNSNYYYSYHRAGCADLNWESDLFYIKDYRCIKIGNISGRGCGYEKRNGIFINKIVGKKTVEINWIKRDSGYYEDKWEFIENYWTKNHLKFTK
jgi:hypothetical protein